MKIGEYYDPRKVFGSSVSVIAKQDERIVLFSSDSGKSSGFKDFMTACPDRYFECGIAEQGTIGMAAGMAAGGFIPVFCAIAPFVTCRPYEMFRNDVGYMHQNVKIVGRNSGITYSDLGSTHHSLEDFAIVRMLPGVVILAPQDPNEIREATKAMLAYDGPVYMRIGNPAIPVLFEDTNSFEIGKGRLICEGTKITVISTGSMTEYVMKAAKALKGDHIHVEHIGLPTVYPLDRELILKSARKTRRVLIVEEHYRDGGLGTLVTELLSEEPDISVRRHGIPKCYATNGPYNDVLSYYELDEEGIIQHIKDFMGR